jgi:hypothetical protein
MEKQQRPKFSRELLNLRKIQEHLAKARDYTEAHKMKLKVMNPNGRFIRP